MIGVSGRFTATRKMAATAAVIGIPIGILMGCAREVDRDRPRLRAVESLRRAADDLEGYSRALKPIPVSFPADHGPHDDFAIEWWYFTGNLETETGDHFGYQLTFFRSALAPPFAHQDHEPGRPFPVSTSRWATRQTYLAHFALSDVSAEHFAAAERISRGAADLAGARAQPFAVWVLDWQAASIDGGDDNAGTIFPLRLLANAQGAEGQPYGIDLVLDAGKSLVLHGESGLSRKGTAPGNASYYVSRTRMPTEGTVVRADGTSVTVSGNSWLDREWSTSVLDAEQIGWDWFSLQLDDGRELMLFELRRADGTVDPASHGTLIPARLEAPSRDSAGRPTRHLESTAFSLTVLDRWQSRTGVRYPSRWRIEVPSAGLELLVEPWLVNQELDISFRYYEGAVRIRDRTGRSLGSGYVELVGYDDTAVRPAGGGAVE